MQDHVLSNVVKVLLLIVLIQASVFAQTKIFDFQYVDSLEYPNSLQEFNSELIGITNRTNIGDDCKHRLVKYDISNGNIIFEKQIDSICVETNNCIDRCLKPLNLKITESVTSIMLGASSQDYITILEFDDEKSNIVKQKDFVEDYLFGPPNILRIDDNVFNSFNIKSAITDSTWLRLKLYRYERQDSLLIRELLLEATSVRNLNQNIISFGNNKYSSIVIMYQDASVDSEFSDSLCGVQLIRYNNETKEVDSKFIEYDKNYFYDSQLTHNNRNYIIARKFDKDFKNTLPYTGKYIVMEYNPETNSLEEVKELNFNNRSVIFRIAYDKFTDRFLFVGSTPSKLIHNYLWNYSDYWFASTDVNFNIKTEKAFQEASTTYYGEAITSVVPIENGLIIAKREVNETDTLTITNSMLSLYSRDLLTSVTETYPESTINAFPNPATTNHINIESKYFPFDYQLLDASGRLVMDEKNLNKNSVILDISNLSSGVYILKIGNDIRKIIKSN